MSKELGLDSLLETLNAEDAATQAGLNKEASDNSGEQKDTSVADELQNLLTKKASDSETGDTETMSKDNAGIELAQAILGMVKKANNVIEETDEMVADDDARDEATPRQGKTVTETAKALLDRGAQKGEVEAGREEEAAAEGNAGHENPAVASDLDKQAALEELLANGIDFDDAVELVKEASAEVEAGMEKAATVASHIAEGMSFEDAVAMVKEASTKEGYTDLEKAAAVNELVSEGVALDEAVRLVNEAAAQ